jgi:hypothetical protein
MSFLIVSIVPPKNNLLSETGGLLPIKILRGHPSSGPRYTRPYLHLSWLVPGLSDATMVGSAVSFFWDRRVHVVSHVVN